MVHILRSVLYPTGDNHHQQHCVVEVGSSSSSNPALHWRQTAGSSSGVARGPSLQPNQRRYNNPPLFFTQNPEIEEPAPSGFVADSILRGFDLNQAPDRHTSVAPETTATHETSVATQFIHGPQSAASGNAANAAEENGDEISSQPLVPYVGMVFNDLEVAKEVYNEYAFKLGFGIHIGNTKYSQARGATKDDVLSRVFECVHARKPTSAAKSLVSMRDGWSIEEQGVKFYTREVFARFKKILQRSTRFYPLRAEVKELCFDLVPNPGLDLKTYRVQVGFEDETYTCGCNQFEMCGLICPHIVRVTVDMNVRSILDRYMMHRLSNAATTPAPDPKTSGVKFGTPGTNTLKYNSLCRK
ncbi:hypothetical protein ACQ4PT_000966 [Festuca glaucescens]